MLSLGGIGVDRKSLERVLTESSESDPTKPAGNMVTLVIGGAEEFTLMRPKTMDLVLRKRKGFAKLALTTGASIVPVITFGENDTWKQSESKWMKKVNTVAKKLFHFVFPALEGRFGIMVIPFAAKLITVCKYMEELTELYETYKDDFFTDRDRDMCIVK
ncbi:diacylglycerol O-acyltransferase 1 [Entophlyctis luteolus]|nr:diacylglycerol O-acyltransferase 1 [Entophlyctis luteolus]